MYAWKGTHLFHNSFGLHLYTSLLALSFFYFFIINKHVDAERTGRRFPGDIFKHILFMWIVVFLFIFHLNLFLRVQSTISQQWFRKGFGANQVTNPYMNQWWPSLLMHVCHAYMCVTSTRWDNSVDCIPDEGPFLNKSFWSKLNGAQTAFQLKTQNRTLLFIWCGNCPAF